ncbi:adenosylcobinamide-GDP ribazoletransferase [Arachnia propionica]|uniref:Adenosylcobinamide-GDP ribazoletransferase n=1 Tax=Arachnia propionica TaxID=1750 RepID=A0A3P1WXT3_9ACTN|nr:adenosylcobinamide-GDP ribazoletransferase [Arachnia propionica]RRD51462.1 adenosylcobinamide-GDP ribazoletransferase [Arachnia propionica]
MRPVRSLLSSVAMYTVVPVRREEWQQRDFADSLTAFPWLGALLGLVLGGLGWATAWASGSTLLGACVALALLALVTGAMHLDGVADVADALGSRKPAEQARAIMKRSDIGPMGVAALVIVLILDAAALASLPAGIWPVVVAVGLAAGRTTPLAATLPGLGEAADRGTLSALTAGTSGRTGLWVTRLLVLGITVGATWPWLGVSRAVALGAVVVAAWLLAAAWQRHLLRRLARLNGDCYGSLIELTQVAVWLLAAIVMGVL